MKENCKEKHATVLIAILAFTALILLSASLTTCYAEMQTNETITNETPISCAVYFTGIGCPHCALADPVVLQEVLKEKPNLLIIEYEIYQEKENAKIIQEYNKHYNAVLGVPQIIFGKNNLIVGDHPIIDNIRQAVPQQNPCPLLALSKSDGTTKFIDYTAKFQQVDLASLPGNPKFWFRDRILIKKQSSGNSSTWILQFNDDALAAYLQKTNASKNASKIINSSMLSAFLLQPNRLTNYSFSFVKPEDVWLSGKSVSFKYAVMFKVKHTYSSYVIEKKLTLAKITALALADSVNPCALAVLVLMLIAIMTYNPKNRRKVLLAGLAFTFSVYTLYLVYGLILVKFFQLVQVITVIKVWLYKVLAVFAIFLGIMNVKDFFVYRPGGFMTEMPLRLRPKVKKIISGITSVKAAFFIGAFVTIFLLPCTIGPYVIASGILSTLQFIKTLPWLLYYNLLFVLPMLFITFAIYIGFTTVEKVSGWKEKNIRKLHLTAGTLLIVIGALMLAGLL